MTTGRYRRRNASFRPNGARRSDRENNFFLVMVGFSLLVHIVAAAIFSHSPTAPLQRRPPTLSVDLLMPPVGNPQRGSSSASRKIPVPTLAKKEPAPATNVVKKEVVVKKEKVKKEAVVKDDDIAKDIARMKELKKEQDELKGAQDAIAAMKKKTAPTPTATATAGSASGTGDEAGSAIGEWLQQAVKEKWTWTDRKRKDLSAEIEVNFAGNGKIIGYRFKRSSGDALFDKSLTDAFIKLETLPRSLGKPLQETFLFNLDDLQGQ